MLANAIAPGVVHATMLRFRRRPADAMEFVGRFESIANTFRLWRVIVDEFLLTLATKPYMRSGTSFGAPIVSGIAARMLSENPNLSPAELESEIESTPSRINVPEADYAAGRGAALQADVPAQTTVARSVMTAKAPAKPGVPSSMASAQRQAP